MAIKISFLFFSILFFYENFIFSQLIYNRENTENFNVAFVSNIAYKLPYRGNNYKFYGTLSFHIYGKAFVNNRVYNTFMQAQHLGEKNMKGVNVRVLKASQKRNGMLNPKKEKFSGQEIVFMIPMLKNGKPVKFYYRAGLFRFFISLDENGKRKKISADFKSTAVLIKNLDDSARLFGMKVNSVTIRREFINKIKKTEEGKILEKRNVRFKKYLSKKINKKYEEIFSVEFSPERN